MSYKSFRVEDGYVLPTGSNSFVTKWIDTHSSPFVSISVAFTNSLADGYVSIEQSNDRELSQFSGVFPESAQFAGTYGVGVRGDPIDLATIVGTSMVVNSANSPFINGNPGLIYTSNINGARWLRVKYVAIANVATKVNVTCSWKSSS